MAFEDKKKSYMDTLFSISTLLKRWQVEIQNKDVDKNYMLKRLGQWIEMLESLRTEIVESLKEVFSQFHEDDGLLFPSATWIVTGSK